MRKTISFTSTCKSRPNRWARLKANLAKANQETEDARNRLGVLQMKCATYQEENAALFLMVDTQNRRITKLIGMLESLTEKNAELVRNKH